MRVEAGGEEGGVGLRGGAEKVESEEEDGGVEKCEEAHHQHVVIVLDAPPQLPLLGRVNIQF